MKTQNVLPKERQYSLEVCYGCKCCHMDCFPF